MKIDSFSMNVGQAVTALIGGTVLPSELCRGLISFIKLSWSNFEDTRIQPPFCTLFSGAVSVLAVTGIKV
jgi:hypothetical protein